MTRILASIGSRYGPDRVVTEERGARILRFGPLGTMQSAVNPGQTGRLVLDYSRMIALCFEATACEAEHVLVLGLGGGAIPMYLKHRYPRMRIQVVEIDPVVVRVAREFFGVSEDSGFSIHLDDGRTFLGQSAGRFDAIVLDAYGPEGIPLHLVSSECLGLVRERLSEKGVVMAYLWERNANPLFGRMLASYRRAFGHVYSIELPTEPGRVVLAFYNRDVQPFDQMRGRAHAFVSSGIPSRGMAECFERGIAMESLHALNEAPLMDPKP